MIPWADALYACDETWWARNKDLWEDFEGMKFSWQKMAAQRFGVIWTPGQNKPGLGLNSLHAGGGSGYMAINLAYHLGASVIAMLGFDCKKGGDGKIHWHGAHKRTGNPSDRVLNEWVHKYPPLYEDLKNQGVELINCTRDTALTIPWMSLEECLST